MTYPIPNITLSEDFGNITYYNNLGNSTNDLDGDSLTYLVVNENVSQVNCTITGNKLDLSSNANWYGNATCEINVSDGFFASNTSFIIDVRNVNDAPYFTQELQNQTFENRLYYFYDINCTDIDSSLIYYINNSYFSINSSGYINRTSPAVNFYNLNVTCGDAQYNVSRTFTLNLTDMEIHLIIPLNTSSIFPRDRNVTFRGYCNSTNADTMLLYGNFSSNGNWTKNQSSRYSNGVNVTWNVTLPQNKNYVWTLWCNNTNGYGKFGDNYTFFLGNYTSSISGFKVDNDDISPYCTNDTTPNVWFNTSEPSLCRISNDLVNYNSMEYEKRIIVNISLNTSWWEYLDYAPIYQYNVSNAYTRIFLNQSKQYEINVTYGRLRAIGSGNQTLVTINYTYKIDSCMYNPKNIPVLTHNCTLPNYYGLVNDSLDYVYLACNNTYGITKTYGINITLYSCEFFMCPNVSSYYDNQRFELDYNVSLITLHHMNLSGNETEYSLSQRNIPVLNQSLNRWNCTFMFINPQTTLVNYSISLNETKNSTQMFRCISNNKIKYNLSTAYTQLFVNATYDDVSAITCEGDYYNVTQKYVNGVSVNGGIWPFITTWRRD